MIMQNLYKKTSKVLGPVHGIWDTLYIGHKATEVSITRLLLIYSIFCHVQYICMKSYNRDINEIMTHSNTGARPLSLLIAH